MEFNQARILSCAAFSEYPGIRRSRGDPAVTCLVGKNESGKMNGRDQRGTWFRSAFFEPGPLALEGTARTVAGPRRQWFMGCQARDFGAVVGRRDHLRAPPMPVHEAAVTTPGSFQRGHGAAHACVRPSPFAYESVSNGRRARRRSSPAIIYVWIAQSSASLSATDACTPLLARPSRATNRS